MNRRKKTLTLLVLICCTILQAAAQSASLGAFRFKFYGRIRGDLFYNSRANYESVDGLFYSYPKDRLPDADGNDLNATPQGSFYMLYTRLGVDVNGPRIGSATSSAKVEIDFRGSGSTFTVPRIRHAYVNLDWDGRFDFLAGQTWHPMFGEVFPSMLNLSTGAPFQPFNRSPLLRFRFTQKRTSLRFTAAAIWQMQFTSAGPDGKTHNYLKNSCVPEIFLGAEYVHAPWNAGIGGELLSLRPRTQVTLDDGSTYKVSERVTSLSGEAHLRYKAPLWEASAKTVLASNLTQLSMPGGFGVVTTDPRTGACTYTPFRHSATWLNFVWGHRWQPGVFLGFLKNLGTGKSITGPVYGSGLDVDCIYSTNWQLCYCLPHWRAGLEFSTSTARYGTLTPADGRVRATHGVTNYRVVGAFMYIF